MCRGHIAMEDSYPLNEPLHSASRGVRVRLSMYDTRSAPHNQPSLRWDYIAEQTLERCNHIILMKCVDPLTHMLYLPQAAFIYGLWKWSCLTEMGTNYPLRLAREGNPSNRVVITSFYTLSLQQPHKSNCAFQSK